MAQKQFRHVIEASIERITSFWLQLLPVEDAAANSIEVALGRKVTGSKLGTNEDFHNKISVKIYPSSCDLNAHINS